jgi:ribA/ribD-fused uncharacterized protein
MRHAAKGDVVDRDTLRSRVTAGETFTYLPFWGHTRRGRTLGRECLSQWYPASFEVEGDRYPTAEHFMMAGKARLFGDDEALQRILAAKSPGEAKKLGRGVRGFDGDIWSAHRSPIVVQANVAKFGQDPALKAFLLATGDKVLVEASPRDRIWGIGLGPDNPAAHDPHAWRGLNLLGFALMEARDRLRG